jgi:hypothetical protein
MERYDLANEKDRLALAELIFTYPAIPHQRKHGPRGYEGYESYRDWLRDEFSYRCVFSLIRETWIGRLANFDIDHLEPRASRSDLTCEYDNLLYLTHRLNLIRGRRRIPDPCQVALGLCLRVHTQGDRLGWIEALNEDGERIERIFRLNSEDAVAERMKWLEIMAIVAAKNEKLFRQLIGYPANLPDLQRKMEKDNTRINGLEKGAHFLLQSGQLPEWYY